MALYDRVKQVSREKNTNFTRLEREAGFAKGSICKWKNISPSVSKVKKVADLLGVTVDELIR